MERIFKMDSCPWVPCKYGQSTASAAAEQHTIMLIQSLWFLHIRDDLQAPLSYVGLI